MRILILVLSVFFTQNVMASTLKLNYSLFFSYMKTMYKLDYEHVTTAFYLVNKKSADNCIIEQAEIVVDEKREQVEFEKQGRLLPFYSDQHRKDGAMIEVKTLNNQHCDLRVTIMAKESELKEINFGKLVVINQQLEGVLRKNAGMIGRYFLPTYSGLRFKLITPIENEAELLQGYSLAKNGDLLINNETLQATEPSKLLNYTVSRITPWIGK